MLARLSLKIKEEINFRQSSLLQGVIMERIDTKYADFLHEGKLNPYSQYVKIDSDGNRWWVIQTLNADAYENIIQKLSAPCNEEDTIELTHQNRTLSVSERKIETLPMSKLMEDFYTKETNREYMLKFLTPTAFRQKRRYIILPDVRLFLQSIMLKFSAASGEVDMQDEEVLENLTENTFVTRHNIRSLAFAAEGQNIPGFLGEVAIRCRGKDAMARYLGLLVKFSEFSGVGIKTSMGMGAVLVGKK